MDINVHEMLECGKYLKAQRLKVRGSLGNSDDGPTCTIDLRLVEDGGVPFGNVTFYIKHREPLVALRDMCVEALQHFDKPK